jgi:hypothetical protein
MKNLIIVLIFLLFYSCDSHKVTQQTKLDPQDPFKVFLKKLKPVNLPFIFRITPEINIDLANMVKLNAADTLFAKTQYPDETYCYGMLTDTSNFYSLIYFFPADNFYPVLATYTKTGKLINQEALSVNGCGSDCRLSYCSQTGILNKDLTIFCADTVKYDFFCDSLGEKIPNSSKILISTKTGKLTNSGKLIIGSEQKTEIKDSL